MTRPAAVRRELLDPLHRVLEWMLRARSGDGALLCPSHGIEHTGKSAGAIVLAIELSRYATGDERQRLVGAAREQCERLVSRLEREEGSVCFTFRPGRHDPYNGSNSVIDGGACSDALATMVLELGGELTEDERQRFTHASVLHAQTYLRYAIVDKGIPAQCAWAMTGAAQAFRLSGHEVLKLSVEVGAERIFSKQRGDGSFPYHPVDWGAGHPGAADASAYYQSRVNAFTSFALEAVHGPSEAERLDAGFAPGLDFLHGLLGPDGIKVGSVEAKPWYWGARWEVASHPFDIAALGVEWRRTRAPRAARALRASWKAWIHHLRADGEPQSHDDRFGGVFGEEQESRASYQCPMFWAAHACWIARTLPQLEEAFDAEPTAAADEPTLRHFPDTDLVRMDVAGLSAWIRGRRPGGNLFHGSPSGGGLLRVFDATSGHNQFLSDRFARRPEAAWSGKRGFTQLGRGWSAGSTDIRFSGWLMRNRLRTERGLSRKARALREPLRALKRGVFDFGSPVASTAFDRSAGLELSGHVVTARGPFAFMDGTSAGGNVVRTFSMGPSGLEVEERCVDPGSVRNLWFRPPTRAVLLEERADFVRYRFGEPLG